MKFHDTLNEKIWDVNTMEMLPEVKEKLEEIADAFIEYIEIPEDAILDMVVTGSSASYNYTPQSDLDLHIIVDYDKVHEDCPVVEGYLGAVKNIFNKEHDIFIHDIPVELYTEEKDQGTVHNGLYSLNTGWIDKPQKIEPTDNDAAVEAKFNEMKEMVDKCDDSEQADELLEKIYNMRKAGLADAGEFSTENLAFKKLRNEGCMDKLRKLKKEKIDKQLSLESYNESLSETLTSGQKLVIQGIWNAYEHGLVTKERTLQRYEEYLSENNMAEGDLVWAIGKDKWDHLHNIMTGNPELDDDLNESINETYDKYCVEVVTKDDDKVYGDSEYFDNIKDASKRYLELTKAFDRENYYINFVEVDEDGDYVKGIDNNYDDPNPLPSTLKNADFINEEVDITDNYIRTRVEEPNTCKKDSFRTKQINDKGDKVILCKDKNTDKMKLQSKLKKRKESIKESLQNEYKQAFDLLVEGANIVGTLDTDFGKQFIKDVENLYKLKSDKLKLSVAKEMLKDIQGYLVDEQYDGYNAKIYKFMNNSKNESMKENLEPKFKKGDIVKDKQANELVITNVMNNTSEPEYLVEYIYTIGSQPDLNKHRKESELKAIKGMRLIELEKLLKKKNNNKNESIKEEISDMTKQDIDNVMEVLKNDKKYFYDNHISTHVLYLDAIKKRIPEFLDMTEQEVGDILSNLGYPVSYNPYGTYDNFVADEKMSYEEFNKWVDYIPYMLDESMREDYEDDDYEDIPEEMHKERYVTYFETQEGRQKYTIYHVYTDSTDDSYNELCDKRDNQLGMYSSYKELKDALKERAEKIAKQQGWTVRSIENLGEDDKYYRERNKWESVNESVKKLTANDIINIYNKLGYYYVGKKNETRTIVSIDKETIPNMTELLEKNLRQSGKYGWYCAVPVMAVEQNRVVEFLPIYGYTDHYETKWFQPTKEDAIKDDFKTLKSSSFNEATKNFEALGLDNDIIKMLIFGRPKYVFYKLKEGKLARFVINQENYYAEYEAKGLIISIDKGVKEKIEEFLKKNNFKYEYLENENKNESLKENIELPMDTENEPFIEVIYHYGRPLYGYRLIDGILYYTGKNGTKQIGKNVTKDNLAKRILSHAKNATKMDIEQIKVDDEIIWDMVDGFNESLDEDMIVINALNKHIRVVNKKLNENVDSEYENIVIFGSTSNIKSRLIKDNLNYSTKSYNGKTRKHDGLLVKVPEDDAAGFEQWLQDNKFKYANLEDLQKDESLHEEQDVVKILTDEDKEYLNRILSKDYPEDSVKYQIENIENMLKNYIWTKWDKGHDTISNAEECQKEYGRKRMLRYLAKANWGHGLTNGKSLGHFKIHAPNTNLEGVKGYNESLHEEFKDGEMLKNIEDIKKIYWNSYYDEDQVRDELKIYQSEHNLTDGDIAWVIGQDSYNRLFHGHEGWDDEDYEDFDEATEIETKNPGMLEVPAGKNVEDLPQSHFEKLVKKKGYEEIIRALTNLEVWNKNKNKPLSRWASNMADKLKKKFRPEDKNESLTKSMKLINKKLDSMFS